MHGYYCAPMAKEFADAKAHHAIPADYIPCILARRHISFPALIHQQRQIMRYRYGTGKTDYADFIEYTGTCAQCGTERVMLRDRNTHHFTQATYTFPDGYLAPPGTKWDRDYLWQLDIKRHPIPGKPVIVDRTP